MKSCHSRRTDGLASDDEHGNAVAAGRVIGGDRGFDLLTVSPNSARYLPPVEPVKRRLRW